VFRISFAIISVFSVTVLSPLKAQDVDARIKTQLINPHNREKQKGLSALLGNPTLISRHLQELQDIISDTDIPSDIRKAALEIVTKIAGNDPAAQLILVDALHEKYNSLRQRLLWHCVVGQGLDGARSFDRTRGRGATEFAQALHQPRGTAWRTRDAGRGPRCRGRQLRQRNDDLLTEALGGNRATAIHRAKHVP